MSLIKKKKKKEKLSHMKGTRKTKAKMRHVFAAQAFLKFLSQ